MITGALPSPTPIAGRPLLYAARTFFWDPVTTTKSACRINSNVSALDGSAVYCTRPRGTPNRSNCSWMCRTRSAQVDAPLGDGERITALPPLSTIIVLFAGVAAGVVGGQTRNNTP